MEYAVNFTVIRVKAFKKVSCKNAKAVSRVAEVAIKYICLRFYVATLAELRQNVPKPLR